MAYYILYSDFYGTGALLDTSSGVEPSAFRGLTNSLEITADLYKHLLEAQCAGMTITFDSSCDFVVHDQECAECSCVKMKAVQAKQLHMEEGSKWASVSHRTSNEATSELCLDASYGNGAAAINVIAAQQGSEIQFSADSFNFYVGAAYFKGGVFIDETPIGEMFGTRINSSDGKRISLLAGDKGLSNFDPKTVIANVLQGKGYGSSVAHGGIGAIGLFWTDQSPSIGSSVSGANLKTVSLFLEDDIGAVTTVKAEWWTATVAAGTWVALCEVGTPSSTNGRNLILAVRTA